MSDPTPAQDDDHYWEMDDERSDEHEYDPDACPDCGLELMGEDWCSTCGWMEEDQEEDGDYDSQELDHEARIR